MAAGHAKGAARSVCSGNLRVMTAMTPRTPAMNERLAAKKWKLDPLDGTSPSGATSATVA
jgi:hypothetical protein